MITQASPRLFPTMQPGICSHNYHKMTILRKHLLEPAGAVIAPDCLSPLAAVEDTRLSEGPRAEWAPVSCFLRRRLFWCRSTCLFHCAGISSSVRTDMGPPVRAVVLLGKTPSAWMRQDDSMASTVRGGTGIHHAQQMDLSLLDTNKPSSNPSVGQICHKTTVLCRTKYIYFNLHYLTRYI